MELARQRLEPSKDPMLELAFKRVDEASVLIRYAADYTGIGRAEYISTSVQNLNKAVRLINQALLILP